MSRRIRSSEVQLGESLIIGNSLKLTEGTSFNDDESNKDELHIQLKEKEFKQKLELMLTEAQHQANSIIHDAKNNAAKIIEASEQEMKKKEEDFEHLKINVLNEVKQEGFKLAMKKVNKKHMKMFT